MPHPGNLSKAYIHNRETVQNANCSSGRALAKSQGCSTGFTW